MKILCLGDSNTYGYDPRAIFGSEYDHPWPAILAEQTGWEVVNLGENGRKIPAAPVFISWINQLLHRHLPADRLILMLGTNDIDDAFSNEHLPAERMDAYLAILRAEFPNLPILLLIPPCVTYGRKAEAISQILREDYRRLAEKHRLSCLDTNDWELELAYDGVHLTEEAHEKLAQRLGQALL